MTHVGGYVWVDSPLHRMPAAPKFVLLVVAIALVVAARTPVSLCMATALVALLVAVSRVGARRAVGAAWSTRWFCLTIFAMNALLFSAENPIWKLGFLHLTRAGMAQGALVVAHVFLVMVLGALLTATTRPQQLVSGVRDLLRPLSLLGVNTEPAALAVGVTIQFVPTLVRETRYLMRAQSARSGSSSGRLSEQIANFVRLLVPIFVSAFRRADELSVAMEARGYRLGGGRSRDGRKGSRQ